MTDDLDAAAQQWRTEGWCLVDGLVPVADIDAAADDVARLYARDTFDDYNKAKGLGVFGDPDGKAFRGEQFDGMRGFPFAGTGALNDLYVHPRVVGFAKHAMQSDDLRIYQASAWGKWAGAVNYEQPLHQDGNHSLLPPRMEPGYWHMETFLYLSDVDADSAPPQLVPRSESNRAYEDLYTREVSATGKRGALLAYRSDVWHRGTNFGRPDASRFVAGIAFKLADQDWFGYDAFPRLGNNAIFAKFVAEKTPEDLALFGIPRPAHGYWNQQTVEAMAAQYPGLDMTPWRDALVG